MKENSFNEFYEIIEPILKNEHVSEMNRYIQHGKITTFDHCFSVAKLSFIIGKTLPLHVNMNALMYGAMLHDFYLYDWHLRGDGSHRLHGFRHAKRAANNASDIFRIDKNVYEIIYSHMWPLNILRFPRSREARIVCFADKTSALYETLFLRK